MPGDVLFFGLLFVLSFLTGRLFCGWVCPAGALQDFCIDINKKPARNKWNWIKMIPFIPWMIFYVFFVIHTGGFKQYDFFYKRAFGISITGTNEWWMYLDTVLLVFLKTVLTGKRGICHYLCWISPFMIIGGKVRDLLRIPSLRLVTQPDLCNDCGLCTRKCPMSLPIEELLVNGQIYHSECTLCATCIDTCVKGAIKFGFRNSLRKHRSVNLSYNNILWC